MERRKFLVGVPLLAIGTALFYSNFKWRSWNKTPDWDYLMRSESLLSSLADTIIPETDSPSASACGVHHFIIKMVKDCTEIKTQNKFISGLKELEDYTKTLFNKPFSSCSEPQKITILNHLDQESRLTGRLVEKAQKVLSGQAFFPTLKEYCVKGYFTSEGGATRALRYSHTPSKYIPCEPYTAGEKAWATN